MQKQTENVKLDSDIVEQVRKYKLKTGVTITKFIEIAITEKLKKNKR